ncbi:MAG: TAT-variant-translocated molybdopterin oxidoreductase [Ignavibacteria bacterium]|nr:TAT-variant-translocated molybdopterin oxidoreductase [Ignavibacteria bacterium]
MEDKNTNKDVNYWRGFNELNNDPGFLQAKKNEFAEGVSEAPDESGMSGLSRRKFLTLLASSAALAATACSDYRDKGAIVPYNKKPEEVTIGNPNFYASTCTACPNACGILIKTREGRPIKVDGNPDHPVNKGKICASGQANILNLYDPSRVKDAMLKTGAGFTAVDWLETDIKITDELKKASAAGKEIAVITHTINSPSLKQLFADFTSKYSTAKFYSYELVNDTNKLNAFKKSYGKDGFPVINWKEAKIILSLESDFLGKEGNSVEAARLYAESRDVMTKGGEFNKLYAVEGSFTVTGANSDYRIKLRTDAIEEFVYALISSAGENDSALNDFVKKYNLKKNTISELAEDLRKNKGKSIVLAGNHLPESTHIAVNKLNDLLGNTKLYSKENFSTPVIPLSSKQDIESLINRMNSGNVGAVIHFDTNPVYHFSSDYKYADALKKAGLVITLGESANETAEAGNYLLGINHNFESWGDHKIRTGILSLQQPVIAALYKTRQKEAVLLNWISDKPEQFAENNYMTYIKTYWEKNIYAAVNTKVDFKNFWYNSLHDGVVVYNEKFDDNFAFKNEAFSNSPAFRASSGAVVLLAKSSFIGDGRFANNGWLQELPNPISKVVWDNYASISPTAADKLGVKTNDMLEINAGGKTLKAAAFVQPGMADDVVSIDLGYGRKSSGVIGNGVGFNSIDLISKNTNLSDWFYNDGKVTKSSGTYEIISTQEQYAIDQERYNDIHLKREIIREGSYEEYLLNPNFIKEEKGEAKLFNIVPSYEYTTTKWAMSIDLNRCIGCNYCVAACNVENNIPVVGKEQVGKHRNMMWLRIDRYYGGKSDDPKVSFQPMLCQHCDNAPCENVCPVAATNHSPDGLNQMAYNRCVGTRYCSNNCPYKVRRFNYFNFRDNLADGYYENKSLSLLHNPEVTVRSRGVMEKCSFCVQRIMDERQKATQEKRELNGDNVTTACQDACPTNAIVFGDLTKKDSEIVKHRKHELGYHVLEEINVRPNVTYIAKLRNIKPEKKS